MDALFLPSRESSLAVLHYAMQLARRDSNRLPLLVIETTPKSDVLSIANRLLGLLHSSECLGVLNSGHTLLVLLDGKGNPVQQQKHLEKLKNLLRGDTHLLEAGLRFEVRIFPDDGATITQLLRSIYER